MWDTAAQGCQCSTCRLQSNAGGRGVSRRRKFANADTQSTFYEHRAAECHAAEAPGRVGQPELERNACRTKHYDIANANTVQLRRGRAHCHTELGFLHVGPFRAARGRSFAMAHKSNLEDPVTTDPVLALLLLANLELIIAQATSPKLAGASVAVPWVIANAAQPPIFGPGSARSVSIVTQPDANSPVMSPVIEVEVMNPNAPVSTIEVRLNGAVVASRVPDWQWLSSAIDAAVANIP